PSHLPAANRDRASGRRPQLVRRGHAVRRRPVRAHRIAGRARILRPDGRAGVAAARRPLRAQFGGGGLRAVCDPKHGADLPKPRDGGQSRVSVAYVCDQHYVDLKWPKKPTTVFEVASPSPHYWKAGILNDFEVDHWQAGPSIQQDYKDTSAIGIPNSSMPPKA